MLKALCKHYDVEYREQSGKSIISALSSSITARYIAGGVKLFFGLGSFFGAGASAI